MLSYMKCGKTECEKPRLPEKAFCEEHAAAERETAQLLINQKIPLDECLVEYRNNGSQLFMRFEDETVLRFELAERGTTPPAYDKGWNDAIDAMQRLREVTEPPKELDFLSLRRAAERGTTPPDDEQPVCTYSDLPGMNTTLSVAATQRAPVEQGRDELQELKLSSEGGRSGSSHPVTLLSSPSPASADHAREGALRGLVAKWRGLRGVDWSAEPDGWKVTFNVCADELERALADGKEGGE